MNKSKKLIEEYRILECHIDRLDTKLNEGRWVTRGDEPYRRDALVTVFAKLAELKQEINAYWEKEIGQAVTLDIRCGEFKR